MRDGALDRAEVERRSTMYSPIKADRWSCGHVLQHFLDKLQKWDELFIAIAEQLKAQDPNERPSLLELHNWSAATRSLGVANARTAKQRERKGSRPLEAPIRETVALPGAKRQTHQERPPTYVDASVFD